MKQVRVTGLVVFMLLIALLNTTVYAACNPDGTAGNDVIVCDNAPDDTNGITGGDGNDQITINAGATVSGASQTVNGGGGDDLIINNGSVLGMIFGGYTVPTGSDTIINNGLAYEISADGSGGTIGGSDTIINNGTVTYAIVGSEAGDLIINNGNAGGIALGHGLSRGADTVINNGTVGSIGGVMSSGMTDVNTVINNGTVTDRIFLSQDSDLVILQDGANGGDDNYLLIDPWIGANPDELRFEFSFESDEEFEDFEALIATKNPAADSVIFNGQTFEWRNVETLSVTRGAPSSNDGRLNGGIENNGRTAAVYCSYYDGGGVIIYGIDANAEGYLLYSVSSEDAHAALQEAHNTNEHVLIAEEDGQSLWALTSNELQIHDADGQYDFIFNPTICGIPLAS